MAELRVGPQTGTTPIEEAVEAAARAIYETERDPSYEGEEWDWPNIDESYDKPDESITDPEWCRDEFRNIARAALAAAVPLALDEAARRIEALKASDPYCLHGLNQAVAAVRELRNEWTR